MTNLTFNEALAWLSGAKVPYTRIITGMVFAVQFGKWTVWKMEDMKRTQYDIMFSHGKYTVRELT